MHFFFFIFALVKCSFGAALIGHENSTVAKSGILDGDYSFTDYLSYGPYIDSDYAADYDYDYYSDYAAMMDYLQLLQRPRMMDYYDTGFGGRGLSMSSLFGLARNRIPRWRNPLFRRNAMTGRGLFRQLGYPWMQYGPQHWRKHSAKPLTTTTTSTTTTTTTTPTPTTTTSTSTTTTSTIPLRVLQNVMDKKSSSYEFYDYSDFELVGSANGVDLESDAAKSLHIPPNVMVPLPSPVKKKTKIISVDRGEYIPGGVQLAHKFSSLKACMKACASSPTCFAGDYNEWLGLCYIHSNFTACQTTSRDKKVTHFKKVPCTVTNAPRGLVILGTSLDAGIEEKGVDSITDCITKCAEAGIGIPETNAGLTQQICFGIDFDFATHKCYFHVRNNFPTQRICGRFFLRPPRDLVQHPSGVFISMCPNFRG